MEAKSVDLDFIFRMYTSCPHDPKALTLDVRNQKDFKKSHLLTAYSIRLSSAGDALLDYSQASYSLGWSQGCWWGRHVLVLGPEALKKDHPVIAYLAKEGKAASLHYFKEGFAHIQQQLPYLCSASVKANCSKRFPSQILPGLLYLGDWEHAESADRLNEINVKRCARR